MDRAEIAEAVERGVVEVDRKEAILDHLEMATQGEDLKGIQTRTLEDHPMATTVRDDQVEMVRHLEDHLLEDRLLEDRQDLAFQAQIHQVHQEDLQVQ